jgi:hypothetical protein
MEKQRRIENGENELTMEILGNEIVNKCILLLHSQLQVAMNQIGAKSVLKTVTASIQRSASNL